MTRLHRLGAATLAAALLSGTSCGALTADEVWASLQARMTSMGQTVTVGSQSKSGGTLVLKDITATSKQATGSATVTIPEMDLAEAGGTVTLTVPQKVTAAAEGSDPKGGSTKFGIDITNAGLKTAITGSADDMTYATTADSITLSLASLEVDGKPVQVKGNMTLAGFSGTSHSAGADPATIDSSGSVKTMSLLVDANDPEGKGTFHVDATMSDFASTAKVAIPKAMDPQNLAASIAAGYAMSVNATYGQTAMNLNGTSPDGPVKATGGLGSGSFTLDIGKDHFTYGGGSKDAKLSLTAPKMPFPSLDLTEKEAAFSLTVPVAKSDVAQPFAVVVKVIGLGLNQDVWSMLDPKNALPHDPATLILDLAGKAKLGFDMFDPGMKDHPPAKPGDLEALNINQLELTAAGADLSGTGAMTFNNTGPTPMPIGKIDLKLTGGNGLIDKLIAMGLVPQDQAMGVKMMLGMFAKPAGNDVMTSEIEFKDDGSILANGQRIK